MTAMPESWQTVEQIFHEALDVPEAERAAFIERSCAGDRDLAARVMTLLKHFDQRTTGLAAPIQPVASDLFTTRTEDENLMSGAVLGPYRIDRKLGQGGMGAVYLATDTRLDREVAVKVVSKSFANTQDARARFQREARSAAALAHANIAVLHDFGETGETPWLVMEYVRGASLRSKLLAGPFAEATLLRYGGQIAAALGHAHSRRIIHRDIKPENILISDDGNVKVIDFGLARAVHDGTALASDITQRCTFLGTPAYAAPELLSGGTASTRSDVYSLGVVLFEMACGEHPFSTLSGSALAGAILAGERAAVKARNPGLAASVAAVIERCMARDPSARYRDGGEIEAELGRIAAGEESPQDAPAKPCLAILDFVNIGGASAQDWLGTGIAETLSADLAKLNTVRVASRARVQAIVARSGDPRIETAAAAELGRELGARWIVSGGYQHIRGRVRVTPKLIDTSTGEVLATEKVDGLWEDLFDVQDRVVATLLQALAVRFGTTDEHRIVAPETRNLMAYEHYVRGRQEMYQMQKKSLTAAIAHFEKAIELDPDYALAYSGLGTSHALQFLRTSDPQDIARCSVSFEKAIELDPELGEPYPWLANIRGRKNDPAGAFAAGLRGVELQPDLPESHYFYGGVHYMFAECRLENVARSPSFLAEAIRLQPKFHPAWLALGVTAMFLGKHDAAVRVLLQALRMEGEDDLIYRFVGACTLLGIAFTRSGEWDSGRKYHLQALESLKTSDHVYRDTFVTLSACGLGDIELRSGNFQAALARYRHAGRIVKESPRIAGSARLLVRVSTGLAAAYAGAGDLDRARQLSGDAAKQIDAVAAQLSTVTFECGLAQLHLGLAVAELRLNSVELAAECLQRAREKGWMDLGWLLKDPELRLLHGHPVFLSFIDELRSMPEVEVPVPVQAHSSSLSA
jgi:serine/threonine protein kinase/tetratricopeptide (TPR) repeat protein